MMACSSRFRVDADEHQDFVAGNAFTKSFSAMDFFNDSPWLRIPEHRKAEITVEPMYPRPRLLGGASNSGKQSKLAALAAKRRQKETQASSSKPAASSESQEGYLSSLNRLRINSSPHAKAESLIGQDTKPKGPLDSTSTPANAPEGFAKHIEGEKDSEPSFEIRQDLRGRPSAFARIMTAHDTESQNVCPADLLLRDADTKSFNFAEPSPDDIVTKAQSAKGRT
jgi:elongation factor 1 alpha-like protein